MSTNMVYHGNTSQDNILLHQSNPAYIKTSDIHIYDEIPGGQYEEIPAVKETNLHNNDDNDDANQVNQEDQDNGSNVSQVNQEDQDNEDSEGYVDTGVIDDDANQNNENYVSQLVNQQGQDYGGYDHLFSQQDQDNEGYISQVNQQDHKENVGCADSLTIDDEDK